jgi:tight adherence protein C
MMDHPTELLIALCWAACGAGLAWYCALTAQDITYVTLADGRRQERALPLIFRLLLPLVPNLAGWVNRPVFNKERERVDRQLVAAGYEGVLSANEYLSLRFLVPMVMGPVIIVLLVLLFEAVPGRTGIMLRDRQVVMHVLILLLLYLKPTRWLRAMLKQRHGRIERALPFVLDLLTLSVEAGLDFMTAIKRILDHRAMDPLGEDLLRVFREVQVGKTRREALRNMATRAMHQDVTGVVSSLVQADELGVSIGYILRVQSEQMRTRRFQRAEKLAQEAPVKLLFPLIAFIFPSVFIVLLGPIILQVMRHGF